MIDRSAGMTDALWSYNEHKIIRTQDDLPSIQTAYLEGKNNTEVKVVETRGGNANALNPYKAHADTNTDDHTDKNENEHTY